MAARLIAITGGIGAGKSVVSRVLRVLGFEVFDCDAEAKALMDKDIEIRQRIEAEICAEAVVDGKINRQRLAAEVFGNEKKLSRLNSIVHNAVRVWLHKWHAAQSGDIVFVESAILYSSGLAAMVDEEWRVVAPRQLRVARVMRRNGIAAEAVTARMDAQRADEEPAEPLDIVETIVNDDSHAVLPQVFQALATTTSRRSPRLSVKP